MPYYFFVCTDCCEVRQIHFTMAAVGEAKVMCGCGRRMHRRYTSPMVISCKSAAELAERALRGEETVPGLTREDSMATAAQMARDRKR